MATSKIKARDFASVEYNIPNDTDIHNYDYPSGYTINNCVLVSAKCYTAYGTWVDSSYDDGKYFGYFRYQFDNFNYAAKTAGATSKIVFTFAKI